MAEHCNAFWDYVLDEVLEAIPWNFTKKTRTLDFATGFGYYDEDTDTKTITGISQASEAVVTCVAHGFSTGHTVYIYDVAGMTQVNERVFEVENATADTFKLTDIDSQIFDAYTSGGSCYRKEVDPKYSSGYTYDLPTDYLKALHLSDKNQEFEIAGAGSNRRLLTTKDDAILVYISLDDTPSQFKNRFISVLAYRLAAELALPLGKKGAKADKMYSLYEYQLGKRAAFR
jgi:hypothetical protein